jgi:Phage integrase, N-terminal SAM-like domain
VEVTGAASGRQLAASQTELQTVADYARIEIAQRKLAPKTRAQYSVLLEKHILPRLGGAPVCELTPAMIRTWYSELPATLTKTRADAYMLLKSICKTAVKDKVLQAGCSPGTSRTTSWRG